MATTVFIKKESSPNFIDVTLLSLSPQLLIYIQQQIALINASWNDNLLTDTTDSLVNIACDITNHLYTNPALDSLEVGLNNYDLLFVKDGETKPFKSKARLHQWYPGMIRLNPSL